MIWLAIQTGPFICVNANSAKSKMLGKSYDSKITEIPLTLAIHHGRKNLGQNVCRLLYILAQFQVKRKLDYYNRKVNVQIISRVVKRVRKLRNFKRN